MLLFGLGRGRVGFIEYLLFFLKIRSAHPWFNHDKYERAHRLDVRRAVCAGRQGLVAIRGTRLRSDTRYAIWISEHAHDAAKVGSFLERSDEASPWLIPMQN